MQVQDVYVPIVLSVLFGVMVILGTIATVLLLMRRLRSGGTFLALLWFWTVIYMIVGPGMHFTLAASKCFAVEISAIARSMFQLGLRLNNTSCF
jgi:hypothetical protein